MISAPRDLRAIVYQLVERAMAPSRSRRKTAVKTAVGMGQWCARRADPISPLRRASRTPRCGRSGTHANVQQSVLVSLAPD